MHETLHKVGFSAPSPIRPPFISKITETLRTDLQFELPGNYKRGAGDTYFSGKMLARLARVLVIAQEVGMDKGVGPDNSLYLSALSHLKESVSVWLNSTAVSPLVYDHAWGGLVGCGCLFEGETCLNRYPDCPALQDSGQNFGSVISLFP
jgi:endoglucanase Acf2